MGRTAEYEQSWRGCENRANGVINVCDWDAIDVHLVSSHGQPVRLYQQRT